MLQRIADALEHCSAADNVCIVPGACATGPMSTCLSGVGRRGGRRFASDFIRCKMLSGNPTQRLLVDPGAGSPTAEEHPLESEEEFLEMLSYEYHASQESMAEVRQQRDIAAHLFALSMHNLGSTAVFSQWAEQAAATSGPIDIPADGMTLRVRVGVRGRVRG
jgi:hypothetical protein